MALAWPLVTSIRNLDVQEFVLLLVVLSRKPRKCVNLVTTLSWLGQDSFLPDYLQTTFPCLKVTQ